jgi:hypothetical protein
MPELSYASLISFRYYLLYLNTFVLPLERVFEFIGEFPPKTSKPLNFYLLELELPLPHDLHARTFERVHLEEFEARAYDCRLTDPQRVDSLVCYVHSSFREKCKSLNGYRSCDWSLFRHSLINTFGTITPHHQTMKQKLRNFVEDSSRMRMDREDDVLQYYRTFQHYSDPLVHSGYLTEKDRDIEFWYGFHPHDRDVVWPRLLAMYPFQPHDIPFHFERVFDCACRAFAYDERLSFGPREEEFESRIVTRRLPRHPSSSYTPDPQEFPSFSPSNPESMYTPAPSAPEDKPETMPETMLSITPPTLLSIPPVISLASSCTNVVPESKSEPASTPSITPSPFSLSPTTSLASSCIAVDSEPESISERASLYSCPSTSSEPSLPLLPSSCHVNVPEPECTLSTLPMSTSPAPSSANGDFENMTTHSFPSTLAPSLSFSNPSTELECSLFSALSATEVQLPELATPLSTSPYSSTGAHNIPNVVEVPEMATVPELELALIPDRFTASFSSHSSSLSPSDFVGQLSVSCIHESTPASAIDLVLLSLSETSSESRETIPIPHSPESPLGVSNVPVLTHSTSQAKSQERTFEVTSHEVTPEVTSTPPLRASALEVPPPLSDRSHAFPSRPLSTVENSSLKFGPESSLGEIVPIVPALSLEASLNFPDSPHSSQLQPPHEYTQGDAVSAPIEASLNVLAPPHSTPPQRPLGVTPVDLDSSPLELRPAPASSTTPSILQQRPFEVTQQVSTAQQQSYLAPQQLKLQDLLLVYQVTVSSTLTPRLHFTSLPLPLSSSPRSACLDPPFVFATTAVLFSYLVVSKTSSTFTCKLWKKNEDIGDDRNRDHTTMPGNDFDFAQLFHHAQYMPHAARLVFDPGGLVSAPAPSTDTREWSQGLTAQHSAATIVNTRSPSVRAARALSPKPHFSYLDLCCLDARTVICFPYLF